LDFFPSCRLRVFAAVFLETGAPFPALGSPRFERDTAFFCGIKTHASRLDPSGADIGRRAVCQRSFAFLDLLFRRLTSLPLPSLLLTMRRRSRFRIRGFFFPDRDMRRLDLFCSLLIIFLSLPPSYWYFGAVVALRPVFYPKVQIFVSFLRPSAVLPSGVSLCAARSLLPRVSRSCDEGHIPFVSAASEVYFLGPPSTSGCLWRAGPKPAR